MKQQLSMEGKRMPLLHCLLFRGFILTLIATISLSQSDKKSYIIYLGNLPKGGSSATSLHNNILQEVFGSDPVAKSVLYSYKRSFNGFVVELTEDEARKIAGVSGVVSVFPNGKKILHTTRSWDFMGFSQQVQRQTSESDVIIGHLDTGIWPESESFNDQGLRPPPNKWKGSCRTAKNFTCNNKIIGARYYRSDGLFNSNDFISPRDSNGHGTHTASTAAGRLVNGANLFGLGTGTARGGVPSARIAVYKTCWSDGCSDADILAAFDDAIADGVDIITLSVGSTEVDDYFSNSIAIGAFHAMENRILTVTAAGNDGPGRPTIKDFSPWTLTVAASTMDRKFLTRVKLGNGMVYEGVSINTFDLKNEMYPIIHARDAPNINSTPASSRFCFPNSLNHKLVKGKIVVCDNLVTLSEPLNAGAIGALFQGNEPKDVASTFALPASHLDMVDGSQIENYPTRIDYRNASATIFKSDEGNDTLAPYVASFSSRGPSPITPDILKPDLTAPGVDILAAWSLVQSVSETSVDNRFAPFNIISGTSMACPHVSGAAAYVKSFHPTWSPAAIKSALMTTASTMSPGMNSDAEFAYGSGLLNPVKAINPGLIYDADKHDYVNFLCRQGYGTRLLQQVTGDKTKCPEATNGTVPDLNYPSFSVFTSSSTTVNHVFNRTVTNVGSPTAVYRANANFPTGALKIRVNPNVLSFTSVGEKLSFEVIVEGTMDESMVSGSLVWDDGEHQVRSPIIAFISIST
ncbi:hypothetical protein V6N13_062708 [Hibiscus sabdariffa]